MPRRISSIALAAAAYLLSIGGIARSQEVAPAPVPKEVVQQPQPASRPASGPLGAKKVPLSPQPASVPAVASAASPPASSAEWQKAKKEQ